MTATLIDDQQLLAAKPDVNYKDLTAQPSPQDFLVLTRVKGVVSVAQLCSVSGLGREKTLAAIETLIEVGLLQMVDDKGQPIEPPRKPAASRSSDVLAPDDRTVVMGAEAAQYAIPSQEEPSEPFFSEVIAMSAAPSEPISEDPLPELGDFEVDHQPVAATTEQYAGGTRAGSPSRSEPSIAIEVIDEPRRPPSKPREPEPEPTPQPSFQSVVQATDDDDLFMPDSPAHIARVEGRAPIKRDRQKERVEAAQPAAQRAKEAPAASLVDISGYRRFPVDYASYESRHPRVEQIDAETQQEVDFVFDHLEYVDFYQLFGVTPDADRKEIRSAYFALSKRFHPDKFFRDDVGPLSERVDAIFRFVTKGYQTLSKKDNRAEYDQALERARAQAEHVSADEDRKRAMAADMLERRALQLEQQGQFAQAAAEFKKVGGLRRDVHAYVKAASLFLRANQQLDEAATLARAAVRELPQEVEPRLVLGQIYEKNQMLAEAAAVFGEAQALAPTDPSIRVHLERVRSQQ